MNTKPLIDTSKFVFSKNKPAIDTGKFIFSNAEPVYEKGLIKSNNEFNVEGIHENIKSELSKQNTTPKINENTQPVSEVVQTENVENKPIAATPETNLEPLQAQQEIVPMNKVLSGTVSNGATRSFNEKETALDRLKYYKNHPEYVLPFVQDIDNATEIGKVFIAANKLKNDKPLSDEETNTLTNFVQKSKTDKTWGAQVVDILGMLPGYAGEFAVTGGLYSAGKAATKGALKESAEWLLKENAEKLIKNKAAKFGGEIVGKLGGATVQTLGTGVVRIPTDIAKQMTPDFTIKHDETGKPYAEYLKDGETNIVKASSNALANEWVQTFSEHLGDVLPNAAKLVDEVATKGAITRAFAKINPASKMPALKEFADRMAFHGTIGEFTEERWAELLNWAIGNGYTPPTPEQMGAELVAFSIPTLLGAGIGKVVGRNEKYKKGNIEENIPPFETQSIKNETVNAEPFNNVGGIEPKNTEIIPTIPEKQPLEASTQKTSPVSEQPETAVTMPPALKEYVYGIDSETGTPDKMPISEITHDENGNFLWNGKPIELTNIQKNSIIDTQELQQRIDKFNNRNVVPETKPVEEQAVTTEEPTTPKETVSEIPVVKKEKFTELLTYPYDAIISKSGRKLSPFPDKKITSERQAKKVQKLDDKWLYEEAVKEAEIDNNKFVLTLFKALNPDKLSTADRDQLNLYLFDDSNGIRITYSKTEQNTEPVAETQPVPETEPTRDEMSQVKQPWEMNLIEYAKSQLPENIASQITKPEQVQSYKAQYIKDMKGWIAEGKTVPQEVLDEYPDLVNPTTKKPSTVQPPNTPKIGLKFRIKNHNYTVESVDNGVIRMKGRGGYIDLSQAEFEQKYFEAQKSPRKRSANAPMVINSNVLNKYPLLAFIYHAGAKLKDLEGNDAKWVERDELFDNIQVLGKDVAGVKDKYADRDKIVEQANDFMREKNGLEPFKTVDDVFQWADKEMMSLQENKRLNKQHGYAYDPIEINKRMQAEQEIYANKQWESQREQALADLTEIDAPKHLITRLKNEDYNDELREIINYYAKNKGVDEAEGISKGTRDGEEDAFREFKEEVATIVAEKGRAGAKLPEGVTAPNFIQKMTPEELDAFLLDTAKREGVDIEENVEEEPPVSDKEALKPKKIKSNLKFIKHDAMFDGVDTYSKVEYKAGDTVYDVLDENNNVIRTVPESVYEAMTTDLTGDLFGEEYNPPKPEKEEKPKAQEKPQEKTPPPVISDEPIKPKPGQIDMTSILDEASGQNDLFNQKPEEKKPEPDIKYSATMQPVKANITLDDIKEIFPNKDNYGQDKDGNFWFESNGIITKIYMVSEITPDEREFQLGYRRSMRTGERIAGAYTKGNIYVTKYGNKWTLRHEDFHRLVDYGIITNDEYYILKRATAKNNNKAIKDTTEEDVAIYVTSLSETRSNAKNDPLLSIVQKIMDFIDSLINLFHKTSLGIIRDIETGNINQRQINAERILNIPSNIKYSATNDQTPKFVFSQIDLVRLVNDLTNGKFPEVRRQLNAKLGASPEGSFSPAKGKIKVRADVAKDKDLALKVMSHELMHLIDWLPDKELKRGNILGHIAALKGYMHKFIAHDPRSFAPLTEADKARLWDEAKKLLQGNAERLIDEEIITKLKITPEDVLRIWNDSKFDASENKDLYDFIANLSSAEKKSIVKEALAGIVPEELQKYGKEIKEKTGRKISVPNEVSDRAIKIKWNKLIQEEIEKRHLLDNNAMMKELKAFTVKWSPFNPDPKNPYTKYRFSPVELYADAGSAILANPEFVMKEAPHFYEAWFDYLDARPEVQKAYFAVVDDILTGENMKRFRTEFRQDMIEGDIKEKQMIKETAFKFKKGEFLASTVDEIYTLLRMVKKAGESIIPDELNPRFSYENLLYSDDQSEGYMRDMREQVIDEFHKIGMSEVDFGEFLAYKRIAAVGDREDLFNAKGLTQDDAIKLVEEINADWDGKPDEIAENFWNIRQKWFVDKAEQANMYPEELINTIKERNNYVRFCVKKEMDETLVAMVGRSISGHIYKQFGSLKPLGKNPFTATIRQDMYLMKSIVSNTNKKTWANFFLTYFKDIPGVIQEAEHEFNGKFMDYMQPNNKNYGLLVYMDNGKAKGYYIDKQLLDCLGYKQSHYMINLMNKFLEIPKELFVRKKLGFQMFNVVRDYLSLIRNLPTPKGKAPVIWKFATLTKIYIQAYGKNASEIEKKLLFDNVLISRHAYRDWKDGETVLEHILEEYGLTRDEQRKSIGRTFEKVWDGIERVGQYLERRPKIAAKVYLDTFFPEMSNGRKNHIIRTRPGSPAFLIKGSFKHNIDAFLFFYNPIVQGYRASWAAAKDNPATFVAETFIYAILPKLIMWGCLYGLFGWWRQDAMRRISKYDLMNYYCIPMNINENGKVEYLRLPMSDFDRVIGGMFMSGLLSGTEDKLGTMGALFDYTAGQAPTVNPYFSILGATAEYLSGNNIYDHFRNRNVIPEEIQSARGTPEGDKKALESYSKWMCNQFGIDIIYRFENAAFAEPKTLPENVLKYTPMLGPALARFYRVSDQGITEQGYKEIDKLRAKASEELIIAKQGMDKMLEDKPLTQEEMIAVAKHTDSIKGYYGKIFAAKYGNVYSRMLVRAQNVNERMAILKLMQKDHWANNQNNINSYEAPVVSQPIPKANSGNSAGTILRLGTR